MRFYKLIKFLYLVRMGIPLHISQLIFLYMVLLLPSQIQTQNISSRDLIEFCQNNGKRYLAVTSFDMEIASVKSFIKGLYNSSTSNTIMETRFISPKHFHEDDNLILDNINYEQETFVLVGSILKQKNWGRYLNMLTGTKLKSGVFVIADSISYNHTLEIDRLFKSLSESSYFYFLSKEEKHNSVTWKKVITLRNYFYPIVNAIKFDKFNRISTGYDLMGLHIKCSTLSWAPYLTLSNCTGVNKTNCTSTGYLADLMDNLGVMFNFTWDCDGEPNDDWGSIPISGKALEYNAVIVSNLIFENIAN